MRKVLGPRDHRAFLENGFVVVKNAVPRKTAAAAAAFIEARLAERGENAPGLLFVSGPPIDACVTRKALSAVSELLGEDSPFSSSQKRVLSVPRVPRPGAQWSEPFAHTDVDYASLMPEQWAVTLFIFLTRVRSQEGAFVYFAGSANRNRLVAAATPGLMKELEGGSEQSGPYAELLAEPGDALLYHHLLGHCGSENVAGAVTRHALKRGFHPLRRVVPGKKPFSRMSTIEKANSPRYLETLLGTKFPSPRLEARARVSRSLREGDGAGGFAAHDVLRWRGRTVRFSCGKDAPSTIRVASTSGWTLWRADGSLDLGGEKALSLHAFHRGPEIRLFVGTSGGGVRVFRSADLKAWTEDAPLPDVRSASGHYIGAKGSGPNALVAFKTSASRPAAVLCGEELAAELPPGLEALDAFVAPVYSEVEFAVIVEARSAGSKEAPRLLWAPSSDGVRCSGPLVELGVPEGERPRQLRVYARARRYWLAAYLAERGGEERLLWGFIDWERSPARLEPLVDAAALEGALEIVGLR